MILVIVRFQILVDFLKMVTNIKQVVFFSFSSSFSRLRHISNTTLHCYLTINSFSVEMYLKLQFVSV